MERAGRHSGLASRRRAECIVALLGCTVGWGACAHQPQQEQTAALEKRIAELERSYGQAMVRVERLSDRVELLDDKVETQRLAMDRRGSGFGAPMAPLEPLEPLPSRGTLTTDAGLFQGRKVQLPEMQVTVAELPDPPARQLPVEVLAPKADEVGAEEKIVITESDYQKFLELRGEPALSLIHI